MTSSGTTPPETTPSAPTVWPAFQARDAPALIDFLTDTVGFFRTAVYADGDVVAHAQLNWPEGGGVMLGSHDPSRAWTREPGTAGVYVVTDRIDEIWARVQAAGVRVITALQEVDHGGREFGFADPEGNQWSFGTYRGEPVPAT